MLILHRFLTGDCHLLTDLAGNAFVFLEFHNVDDVGVGGCLVGQGVIPGDSAACGGNHSTNDDT